MCIMDDIHDFCVFYASRVTVQCSVRPSKLPYKPEPSANSAMEKVLINETKHIFWKFCLTNEK